MAPSPWAGAGSAPFNNVIGIDPQLTDPDAGDYRPVPGSPAEDYGCQTFPPGRARPHDPRPRHTDPDRRRRDILEVWGSITQDTTWDADTVRVLGDVTVENNVTLTITPGTRVEFEDFYRLEVAGTLLAVGTPDARILFTTDDPQDFSVDDSHAGCWNGIRFDNTPSTNAPSRLAFCILEYSKATAAGGGLHPYGGGAISVTAFSQLTLETCVLRHNVADYGGAIFLYRQANPLILGNLIVDNHALQNGSAIYCAYSYPAVVNNTIVRNLIHNEPSPYIESCAVLSFLAKPALTNNIVRANDPDVFYQHAQLWNNKDYYTRYNNIEDYAATGDNIDADPRFLDPDGADDVPGTVDDRFRLQALSPCVDAGRTAAVPPELATDPDGAARIVDGDYDGDAVVDIGAFEAGSYDCDHDGDVDAADFAQFSTCMAGPGAALEPGCACFDFDRDADLDLADLAGFQTVYTGD